MRRIQNGNERRIHGIQYHVMVSKLGRRNTTKSEGVYWAHCWSFESCSFQVKDWEWPLIGNADLESQYFCFTLLSCRPIICDEYVSVVASDTSTDTKKMKSKCGSKAESNKSNFETDPAGSIATNGASRKWSSGANPKRCIKKKGQNFENMKKNLKRLC